MRKALVQCRDANDAREILGSNRSDWELHGIVRALTRLRRMNSPEEEIRLHAAKILLRTPRSGPATTKRVVDPEFKAKLKDFIARLHQLDAIRDAAQ